MNDQGYKFNAIAEHFPQKLSNIAKSKGLSVGKLRELVWEGVYCINGNCELVEIPLARAFYEFRKAVKKCNRNRELVGIAGEDLEAGDQVVFGEDGKIHKAKNNV